jgi:predicted RNase H-like nuclease
MTEYVAGVDGCKSGWLAAIYNLEDGLFTLTVHSTFRELLDSTENATSIAIDIPIGLTETCEPRQCDQLARRLIGPRRSSVFTAPDRRILAIQTYQEALVWSRSNTASGKGIAQQAFAIYRKILEVDRIMTPKLQDRVIEVHPELCFWELAGKRPLQHPKRRPEGFGERHEMLKRAFPNAEIPNRAEARRLATGVGPDDVLDALAAAWTAARFASGVAERVPMIASLDPRGLRMEMVY